MLTPPLPRPRGGPGRRGPRSLGVSLGIASGMLAAAGAASCAGQALPPPSQPTHLTIIPGLDRKNEAPTALDRHVDVTEVMSECCRRLDVAPGDSNAGSVSAEVSRRPAPAAHHGAPGRRASPPGLPRLAACAALVLRCSKRTTKELPAAQGIATIRLLRQLEQRTGRRIHELFDLVAGTSTGGILAVALALKRLSLEECEDIYRRARRCRPWPRTGLGALCSAVSALCVRAVAC